MHKLQELIRQGPNPDRGLTALVLANHGEVKQARQLLWPWARIAAALDLPASRARALSAAFRSVEKRLKAERVRAAKSPSPSKSGSATGKASATNVDPDSGFRPQAPPKSDESEEEAKKWL